jgi:hypothetical protein
MFSKLHWCVWKSPVRIIVEVTACWQCPSFLAWRAGARFFRGRAATPYLNPARCEPTFAHRHGAGARSVAETQTGRPRSQSLKGLANAAPVQAQAILMGAACRPHEVNSAQNKGHADA